MTTQELLKVLEELKVGVRLPHKLNPKNPSTPIWIQGVVDAQAAYQKLFTSQVLNMHLEVERESDNTVDLSNYDIIQEQGLRSVNRVRVRVDHTGDPDDDFATIFTGDNSHGEADYVQECLANFVRAMR